MIIKQTIVDRVEITRDGTIQVRFAIQVIEDGNVLANDWHRTSFDPLSDVDTQMLTVNAHLQDMGKAPVDDVEIDRIRVVVPVVQTDAVKAAFTQTALQGALTSKSL